MNEHDFGRAGDHKSEARNLDSTGPVPRSEPQTSNHQPRLKSPDRGCRCTERELQSVLLRLILFLARSYFVEVWQCGEPLDGCSLASSLWGGVA